MYRFRAVFKSSNNRRVDKIKNQPRLDDVSNSNAAAASGHGECDKVLIILNPHCFKMP